MARHGDAIWRFLRGLAGTDEAAEDALQECFLAAWRARGSFRGAGSARSWLLTIARNALYRAHRRRTNEPSQFDSVESLEELGPAAGWGAEGSNEDLERLENREWIEAALGRLSDRDREILLLRDVEGLTNEEVSRSLGLSIPTMKSRLHRARLRLMAELRRMESREG